MMSANTGITEEVKALFRSIEAFTDFAFLHEPKKGTISLSNFYISTHDKIYLSRYDRFVWNILVDEDDVYRNDLFDGYR